MKKDHIDPLYPKDAEEAILGAMLLNNAAVEVASEALSAEDFYLPRHGGLFSKMLGMYGSGQHIDAVTVGEGDWATYLSDACPLATGARGYAAIVSAFARRRRIKAAGQEIIDLAVTVEDVEDAIGRADAVLSGATRTTVRDMPTSLEELCATAYHRIEESSKGISRCGAQTTIGDIDDMIGGLEPGALFILAARPSVGKTAMALSILHRVCLNSNAVLFSLEMTKKEILDRLLCAQACVPITNLRTGVLSDDQARQLYEAVPEVAKRKLIIDDTALTMGEIERRVRRIASKVPLSVIVLDYIQLVTLGGRVESSTQEVTAISRQLKLMAKEHQACVLALSQLSRPSKEESDAQRPKLHRLRQSGALEQDADVVAFIHGSEKMGPYMKEFIVEKNRNGATGITKLRWEPLYATFYPIGE